MDFWTQKCQKGGTPKSWVPLKSTILGSFFGPFLDPLFDPKMSLSGPKMGPKMTPKMAQKWVIFDPKNDPKMTLFWPFLVGRAPTHKYGLNIRPNGPPNIWVLAHTVNTPKKGHFWGYPKSSILGYFHGFHGFYVIFVILLKNGVFRDFRDFADFTVLELPRMTGLLIAKKTVLAGTTQNMQKWPKMASRGVIIHVFRGIWPLWVPQNGRFLTPFWRYRPVLTVPAQNHTGASFKYTVLANTDIYPKKGDF